MEEDIVDVYGTEPGGREHIEYRKSVDTGDEGVREAILHRWMLGILGSGFVGLLVFAACMR